METTEIVSVGRELPRIAAAAANGARTVRVTWKNGKEQVIDVAPALFSHKAFIRLRSDDALFSTLKVDEYGDALAWADGSELSAVWLDHLASDHLSNQQFRDAMDQLNFTLDGMAAQLGVGRRLVAEYRKDKPIPRNIALATRYLLEHRKAG